MALRTLVEADSVHFWSSVAKLLSGGLFLAIYARMNIGFVNLCVYRQGMCQISSLFTLE